MKKMFTMRLYALMLAAVMVITFGFTTAFAAETDENRATPELTVSQSDANASELTSRPKHGREEIEITPDMIDENGRIRFNLRDGDDDDDEDWNVIDQWWYFTGSHQGSDRTYDTDTLQFSVKVTGADGSYVGDRVAIKLNDYYDNQLGFTAYANGAWYGYGCIEIIPNRTYYFTYTDLTSSTTQLWIRMVIEW